jgi:hypothetical protein
VKPRTLAILVVLGALALGAGWYFGIASEPSQDAATDAAHLMFPALAPRLADATEVELQHGASTLHIVKDTKTNDWGLAERDGYPIDVSKLHGLLTALTELRLVEKRTADPGEFAKLGLEDPTGKDATSTLVQVLDKSGHPIAAVIAGHSRVRTEGNLPADIYVRRPDESQTWLAEGKLDVDTDALTWLDRDVMDIKPARIATVAITSGTTPVKLARAGDKLVMQEPTDHPKLDDEHVDDVQRALELLSLEDVRADKDAPKGDALGTAVFTTNDGLSITATPTKAGSDLWVRFAAAGTDKAAAEAARLNARLAGWTYEIGSWKQKALIPTMDDLKAAPPPAPAPAPSASPVPAKP